MAAGARIVAAVSRQGEVLCAVPQVPAAQYGGCEAAARGRRSVPPRQVFRPRSQLAVLGRRTATTYYVTTLLYLTYAASPSAPLTPCAPLAQAQAIQATPWVAWATVHSWIINTLN